MRAADVTYVSRERLPTQTIRAVRNQIVSLLDKGISVGIYVDPRKHRVEIHRRDAKPVVLGDDDMFEVPDVLPGFSFAVRELWPE
jgi:Uma2 family endonuclease